MYVCILPCIVRAVYEHLELSLRKNWFMFVCLENKLSSSLKYRLNLLGKYMFVSHTKYT